MRSVPSPAVLTNRVVPSRTKPVDGTFANNEQITLEYDMITLDAFLVFLGAASLPAIYVFILSRWLERQAAPETTKQNARLVAKHELVHHPA